MHVSTHRTFKKQYRRLPLKIQRRFNSRISLLLTDPDSPLLNIHTLTGKRYPLKSMNMTVDYRALFIKTKDTIIFYKIGTHSELYE